MEIRGVSGHFAAPPVPWLRFGQVFVLSERTGKGEDEMETEERIGVEEIERYMPITHGGFHLLTACAGMAIMVCSLAGIFAFTYCIAVMGTGNIVFDWLAPLFLFGLALLATLEVPKYYYHKFPRGVLRWLREYWDKNVKGWSLYYYTEKAPDCRNPYRDYEEPVHTFIGRPDLWPEDFPFQDSFAPALEIPLGGWSSTAKYHQGRGWQIKLSHRDTHNILLNIKGPDGGWGAGEYTPEKILWHHEDFIGVHSLGKHAVNLLYQFDRKVDELAKEYRKRLASESLVQELMDAQQEAATDLEMAIEAISNTSRLGKSKEAKRIREEILVPTLLKLLPEGDPHRKKYETKVA